VPKSVPCSLLSWELDASSLVQERREQEALDAALASGSTDGTPETMDQLEALVAALPR